jgi:hypothetical protein
MGTGGKPGKMCNVSIGLLNWHTFMPFYLLVMFMKWNGVADGNHCGRRGPVVNAPKALSGFQPDAMLLDSKSKVLLHGGMSVMMSDDHRSAWKQLPTHKAAYTVSRAAADSHEERQWQISNMTCW